MLEPDRFNGFSNRRIVAGLIFVFCSFTLYLQGEETE